jgi:hypothetical protein
MNKNSVDLNFIVLDSIKNNKHLMLCLVSTFIGFYLYNILFPKTISNLISKNSIDINDTILSFSLFIIGQGLFCLSDVIYSKSIFKFDNDLINSTISRLIFCYENSKDERDTVLLYTNILKLLNIKFIIHVAIEYLIPVFVITIGTFFTLFQKNAKLAMYLFIIITSCFTYIINYILNNNHEKDDEITYKKELNDIIFNTYYIENYMYVLKIK